MYNFIAVTLSSGYASGFTFMFHLVAEIRLWTLHDGRFARALPGGGSLTALAFSTAGAAKIASATQKLGGTKRMLTFFLVGWVVCYCVFIGIGLVNLCFFHILSRKIDIQCQFFWTWICFFMFFCGLFAGKARWRSLELFLEAPLGGLGKKSDKSSCLQRENNLGLCS